VKAARVAVAVALLPLLGACATKSDVRDLRNDMEAQRAAQDAAIERLLQRTDALLDSLSGQNVRMRGDLANRMVAIERQLVQIQELTGQGQQQLRDLRRQIDTRASDERRPVDGEPGAGAPAAAAGSADELYEASVTALRRGSVSTARSGFEEFLRANPQHRLAPEAQFNIGQAFEQGQDPARALEAYGRVVELYPTSPRAPAALLRMGLVEGQRGNRAQARTRFDQLLRAYPNTAEADEARRELNRMGRE
jgi:tol-pal system protein YbgF